MNFEYSTDEMLEVYERHPLNLESLLKRVGRRSELREVDLAYDPIRQVTDQNHIGGAPFTLKLARAARLESDDRVLDLGCGIGGPARLMASEFGCAVHGVDANTQRVRDAIELTRLTGLLDMATFEVGDFLLVPFMRRYTVVWGQNSWIHCARRGALARRAAEALLPGGRIAFDDICIRRELSGSNERVMYRDIANAWRSTIVHVDEWQRAFREAGFRIALVEEDSEDYVAHYVALTTLARANPEAYPEHEIRGWECARGLGECGAFGFYRIVAELGR